MFTQGRKNWIPARPLAQASGMTDQTFHDLPKRFGPLFNR
jgi:hypothetical protein